MKGQAQHDRKQSKRVKKQTFTIVPCRGDQWSPALSLIKRTTSVIPSVVEESRGNEFFLIPRGKVVRVFKFSSARVRSFCFSSNASARCFDKLNMTENKYVVVKKQLSLLFSVGATIGRPPFFEKKN